MNVVLHTSRSHWCCDVRMLYVMISQYMKACEDFCVETLKKKQLLIYSSVHVVICICLLRVLESSDVALHKFSIVYNLMDLIQNKLSKSLLTVASYMVWIFICYFTLSVCCGGILFSHSRT